MTTHNPRRSETRRAKRRAYLKATELPPGYDARALSLLLRRSAVLNQEDVASALNITRSAVAKLEKKALAKLLWALEPIVKTYKEE
jgi:hypothetical protein